MQAPLKGETIELEINSLGFGGQGIGRYHDLVVFVDDAIPGQKIKCKVFKRKSNFAEAYIQEILTQSPFYLPPLCKHFGNCGGCTLQHLSYSRQLAEKRSQVQEILARIGHLSDAIPLPPLASPDIYTYRNKMEFSFSPVRWLSQEELKNGAILNQRGLYLGLHAKRFYEKVVDLDECHLAPPIVTDIVRTVREIARKSAFPAFTTLDQSGFWRFLVVRPSVFTKDIMVLIIAYHYDESIAKVLKNIVMTEHPEITSLYFGVTQSKANIAYCENEVLLAGRKTIEEKIGDFTFEISSQSFFQSNTKGARQLYEVVKEYAMLQGHEIVYDLYCGAGTISIYCSSYAKRIIGFEATPSSIHDALNNCRKNIISNCDFILGDVREQLADSQKLFSLYGKPDVMIIDPPRGGMHPKSIEAILDFEPQRIVYVSCNPTTLARDLQVLCEEKYTLTKIQPVDMFPHTGHIEVVTQLHRK